MTLVSEDLKYEITDIAKEYNGYTLHQIRALRDFGFVKAGDLGGFLCQNSHLSHSGDCWIDENSNVIGSQISGDYVCYGASIEGSSLHNVGVNDSLIIKSTLVDGICIESRVEKAILNNFHLEDCTIQSNLDGVYLEDAKIESADDFLIMESGDKLIVYKGKDGIRVSFRDFSCPAKEAIRILTSDHYHFSNLNLIIEIIKKFGE